MTRQTRGAYRAIAGTALLLALLSCEESSGNGNQSLSDPEVFEAKAKASFVPIVSGISDGLARLLSALAGGPVDGVVITPTAGGADAVILVDFDGNGSREGSINGGLVGDVSSGALVTIGSVTGDEPSLTGGGSLTATETSPGVILLDDMVGSGGTDPDGSGNASEVDITDGAIALDATTGIPNGFLEFDISGEGESLSVSVTFQPDLQGGFIIHFTGPGLDFTIP
jgi:hypothetical protein